MIHPVVDGQPMRSIGSFRDVEYSIEWMHGCTDASWQTDPGLIHAALRQGAAVTLMEAGWPVWSGTLMQPGADGQMRAMGLWAQAQQAVAIDSLGAPTSIPDVAIDAAIARGAVTWRRPASLSSVPVVTGDAPAGDLMLSDLLDKWAEGAGLRWGVDGRREVYATPWPASSMWMATPGFEPLSPADDSFVTALVGKYFVSDGVEALARVDDPAAQEQYGVRERVVDLTKRGVITGADATGILQAMLDGGATRMGWAEAIEIAPGQLTTLGGTPAMCVEPGEGLRVMGVYDPSWISTPTGFIDIIVGKLTRTVSGSLVLAPVGLEARSFVDVLGEALA